MQVAENYSLLKAQTNNKLELSAS